MFVSDNVAVTHELLKTPFGRKLKEKGICYVRCLTDRNADPAEQTLNSVGEHTGIYNHWQQSFGTDSKEEAEAMAKKKGLSIEWGPGRFMRTKFYTSAFEYCPYSDLNVLYSSVADHDIWFDTWPGMTQLGRMPSYEGAEPGHRPLMLTFGDDTQMTQDELRQFIAVYDHHGYPLRWSQGDVAVICNYRMAHGRPSYFLEAGEKRELGVVLGEMYTRVGSKEGKWPAELPLEHETSAIQA
jgi:hypothetical protein